MGNSLTRRNFYVFEGRTRRAAPLDACIEEPRRISEGFEMRDEQIPDT